MFVELTFLAYLIDRVFGEFKFIKHPVIFMGDFIKLYEKRFYKDDIVSGVFLTLSLILVVLFIIFPISYFISNVFVLAIFASTGIASKMLYDSVKDIAQNPSHIKYLVSRDTKELSSSDINKAGIETYAENLSDGVIAPLFYLLLFGLPGLFVYKAVNTLDSMVGYRNERYENFGKFSARLDDVLNFIPARITSLLICIVSFSSKAFLEYQRYGKMHESINAGYPISAMGLALNLRLGGPTSYFGKIKDKPYFGDGKLDIEVSDLRASLKIGIKIDIFISICFTLFLLFYFY